jgi:acetyl esterase/lipase
MSVAYRVLEPIELWPDGAPGARGDGPADRPVLIPYLPEGDRVRAGVVIYPGGGYQVLAAHEREPVAEWLAGLGLAAFIAEYRVLPYIHPAPLDDGRRAMRLVRHHAADWGLDPRRLGVIGFSAGGHLGGCVSTLFDAGNPDADDPVERQSCRPDAAILCYPAISYHTMPTGGSRVLFGDNRDAKTIDDLSPDANVRPDTPPTFLFHTAEDKVVPVAHSLVYAEALAAQAVPFALHVLPEGPHGVALKGEHPSSRVWPKLCEEWLKGIGFLG